MGWATIISSSCSWARFRCSSSADPPQHPMLIDRLDEVSKGLVLCFPSFATCAWWWCAFSGQCFQGWTKLGLFANSPLHLEIPDKFTSTNCPYKWTRCVSVALTEILIFDGEWAVLYIKIRLWLTVHSENSKQGSLTWLSTCRQIVLLVRNAHNYNAIWSNNYSTRSKM